MKLTRKLVPLAVASAMAVPVLMTSHAANAELSANIGMSNMYLWRGQNLSPDGGMISGGLDYGHESGFYAGVWTSSENAGSETDLYLGFSGEVEGFGYDISYVKYLYPEDLDDLDDSDPTTNAFVDLGDNDLADIVLGLSYGPVSFGAYIASESGVDDDTYFTLTGEHGSFSLTYGWWDLENPGNEYSHLTFGYAATDELSFAISVLSDDIADTLEEDPLFAVSYTKTFDL